MQKFHWKLQPYQEEKIIALAQAINVSIPIAKILCNRNIATYEDAHRFFVPIYESLYDPFLLNGMDIAVERILKAIDCKEKIMIYGDYDVDGTTSTAMLVTFFRELGVEVLYYINDRFSEGYGLSLRGIERAQENEIKLIITVDCGTTAFEPASLCHEKNIDLIICDHHEPKDTLPTALAILNPKLKNSTYPFTGLSGCGVGFKLIQAISTKRDIPNVKSYLDFVAIATAADIVDIIDENRIIMNEGLSNIQKSTRPFVKAMEEVTSTGLNTMNVENIVFRIAPRINAAGRLEHANETLSLLLSETIEEAMPFAIRLNELNTERKRIEKIVYEEANQYASQLIQSYPSSIVVYQPEWHLGILGIVASRLIEKYYLPTIVLTEKNGIIKGSARSIGGVSMIEVLDACKEYLIQYGGHEMAAGLSLEIEHLEVFRKRFDDEINSRVAEEDRFPFIMIDTELTLEQITTNFFKVLKRFEPCGPANRHPVFITENIAIYAKPQLLKEEHLKFKVKDTNNRIFDVIGFRFGKLVFEQLSEGKKVSIVYSLNENVWNNNTSIQLQLKDLCVIN